MFFRRPRPVALVAAGVFGVCLVFSSVVSRTDNAGAQITVATPGTDAPDANPVAPPDPSLAQALRDPAAPPAAGETESGGTGQPALGSGSQSSDSESAFADDTPAEARALAAITFPEEFSQLDQDPLRALDSAEVVKFFDSQSARVRLRGSADQAVVQSTLPLRTENDSGNLQTVDLSLEQQGQHVEPANPLVDVAFPESGAKPVTLPDAGIGLSVDSPEAGTSQPSSFGDDKLFYHEAAKDTDVILAPVTRGFELMTQIRSAAAPEDLSFRVSLPEGAQLQQAPGDEGVEVVRSDERLARITAPVAVDADRQGVPSHLSVTNSDHIKLVTEHQSADTSYPVLVDPVTEDWSNNSWQWHGNPYAPGWWNGTWTAGNTFSTPWLSFGSPTMNNVPGYNNWGGGLYAQVGSGWQIGNGNGGQWIYRPPGAEGGYTTYVKSANLSTINFARNGDTGWNTPYAYWGVYSTHYNNWGHDGNGNPLVATYGSGTLTNANWQAANLGVSDDIDEVVFGMGNNANRTGSSKLAAARTASLGGVTVVEDDAEAPTISYLNSPGTPSLAGWFGGTASVDASAQDHGLGVQYFNLQVPLKAGGSETLAVAANQGCAGTWQSGHLCPYDRIDRLAFNRPDAQMPEGINSVTLHAQDALGKVTDKTFDVRVDRSDPVLTPSGGLYDSTQSGHDLHLVGTDGSKGGQTAADRPTARSGMKRIDLYLDDEADPIKTTGDQPCAAAWGSCRLTLDYTGFDPQAHPEGDYTFHAVGTDQTGRTSAPLEWTYTVEHSPPDVAEIGGPATEGWLHTGTANVTVRATDAGSGVEKVKLVAPGNRTSTTTFDCADGCPRDKTATFQVNVDALPDGVGSLTATAYGPGGAAGPSQSVPIKVDRTSPGVEVTGSPNWLSSGDASIAVTGHDHQSGVQRAVVDLPGGLHLEHAFDCSSGCPQDPSYTFTTPVTSLPQGDNQATARVYGPGDFRSALKAGPVRVDRTAPALSATGPLFDGSPAAPAPSNSTVTVGGDDFGSGLNSLQVLVDGDEASPLAVLAPGDLAATESCQQGHCSFEFDIPIDLSHVSAGQHEVSVVATDQAGHAGTAVHPITFVPPPSVRLADPGAIPAGWLAQDQPVSFGVHAENAGNGVSSLTIEEPRAGGQTNTRSLFSSTCGSPAAPCAPAVDQPVTVDTSLLPEGDNEILIKARDGAGQVSATLPIHIRVDRSAPDLTASGPLLDATQGQLVGSDTQLTANISDLGGGLGALDLLVDGQLDHSIAVEDVLGDGGTQVCNSGVCHLHYEFDASVDEAHGSGIHEFALRAVDVAGHTDTVSSQVTVDLDPPELTLSGPLEDAAGAPPSGGSANLHIAATDHRAAHDDDDGAMRMTGQGGVHSAFVPFENGGAQTFEGWSKRDTQNSLDTLFGGATPDQTAPTLYLGGDYGHPANRVIWSPQGNNAPSAVWDDAWPGVGQWAHWALVYDQDAGTAELFINGASKGVRTLATPYASSPGGLRLGNWGALNGSLFPFHGSFDEFAVYDHAVSADRLAAHHAEGADNDDGYEMSIQRDDPSLYWRLGDPSGSVAVDSSDNGWSGTYIGGPQQDVDGAPVSASSSPYMSGIKELSVQVDESTRPPLQITCQPVCPETAATDFLYRDADWGAGAHTVTVTATDASGNSSEHDVSVNAPLQALHPECSSQPPTTISGGSQTLTAETAKSEIQQDFPGVLAPTVELPTEPDEGTFDPTISPQVTGGDLSVTGSAEGGSIGSAAGSDFTVGQSICLSPTTTTTDETSALRVAEDSVVHANTAPSTDTVIRPTMFGTTVLEHIRDAGAPDAFTWQVELESGEELVELPDGGVAIVDITQPDFEPPDGVPDMPQTDLDSIGDVVTQAETTEHELALANEAVNGQVKAVITPPFAETEDGGSVPVDLEADPNGQITLSVPSNPAVSLVVAFRGISSPDPVALCAVYANSPAEYMKWCLEQTTPPPDPAMDDGTPELDDQEMRADWDASTVRLAAYLQSSGPDPTVAEAAWCGTHPVACPYFWADRDQAWSKAGDMWVVNKDDMRSNAFQHSFWVALMVESHSPVPVCENPLAPGPTCYDPVGPNSWAFDVARLHEKAQLESGDQATKRHAQMDMVNNWIGYRLGLARDQDYGDGDFCKDTAARANNAVNIGMDISPKKWHAQHQDQRFREIFRKQFAKVNGKNVKSLQVKNCKGNAI